MHLFFNIRHGSELIEDLEGTDYSSLAEARVQAVRSAREIMAGRVYAGKPPDHRKFEIADASGRIVLVLPFLDAFEKE